MRSMTNALVAGAFVVGFGLGSLAKGGEALGGAQTQSKPFTMQRIYTGTDGLSHVEHIPLTAESMMAKVTDIQLSVTPPKRPAGAWHVGPERRYIINLTAGGQLEVAEGKVDLPAGSIEYIDDLTGKGHTTANVSNAPRLSIHLKLADQKQIIGPIGKK